MKGVAILTESRYLKPVKQNWYVKNILTEDGLVQDELEKLNISCERIAWDGSIDLSNFRVALFRTTWNYFDELGSFVNFLKKWSPFVSFINPYEQILWNLDKKYLLELSRLGISIVDTKIITKKSYVPLKRICKIKNWENVVIKPCVSAAAWQTYSLSGAQIEASEKMFYELVQKQDMIIQEFQNNIQSFGELSLMIIGGVYSHAVLKRAKSGDFRVQDDFGGSVEPYSPNKNEIKFAENVIRSLPFSPIYARVDIVVNNENLLALSELEIIEPEMWFRFNNAAAKKLAAEIKQCFFES